MTESPTPLRVPVRIPLDSVPTVSGEAMPQAVLFLQIYAFALFLVRSDTVLRPLGGTAFLAGLIAMVGFVAWMASAILGAHDVRRSPSPVRLSLLVFWIVALISYGLMHLHSQEGVEANSADRYLLQLAAWTGVAMIANDGCNSMLDFRKVLRAVSVAGAICGLVAAVQFWFGTDLSVTLRAPLNAIPGFTSDASIDGIMSRSDLSRVAGTALHPIELGVVSAMLLPISLFSARIETRRSALSRFLPPTLILTAVVVSVSRSAILALTLSMGLYIACLRPRRRAVALLVLPVAIVAIFMAAPGLIKTMTDYFSAGSNDSSIATRQADYAMVEDLVGQRPWFGTGGGSYIPTDAFNILDNEYLRMLIELGLIGTIVVVVFYMLFPLILVFKARARSRIDGSRELGAALGAAVAVFPISAATFDAFSFSMFAYLVPLLVGLIGAYWRLIRAEERDRATQAVDHDLISREAT